MTNADRELARGLFLRLVQIGDGAADTRRRVALGELRQLTDDAAALDRVIVGLTDARSRLLSIGDVQALGADAPVEVIHEALIRNWPALRGWLDADRQGLRIERRLGEAAAEWQRSGLDATTRDESLLHSGLRLDEAKARAARPEASLTRDERTFLAASVALAERRAREQADAQRRLTEDKVRIESAEALATAKDAQVRAEKKPTKRLRQLVTAVLVLAAIAGVAAVMAWRGARGAQRDREDAVRLRGVAEVAEAAARDLAALAEVRRPTAVAAAHQSRDPELSVLACGVLRRALAVAHDVTCSSATNRRVFSPFSTTVRSIRVQSADDRRNSSFLDARPAVRTLRAAHAQRRDDSGAPSGLHRDLSARAACDGVSRSRAV